MEKFFTNKKIWKMLIVAFLVIMAVQVLAPATAVYADEEPTDAAQSGDNLVERGILMRPIMSLLVSAGDGVMSILHSQIMGQENDLLPIDLGGTPGFVGVVLGVVVGLVVAIATVALIATGLGAIAAAISAITSQVAVASIGAGTFIFGGVIGGIAGFAVYNAALPETLYLPAYTYSAEEIFKGNILLFNVNFFDTDSKEIWVCYSDVVNSNGEKVKVTGTTATGGTTIEKEAGKKAMKCTLSDYNAKIKNGEGPFTVDYYYYYYNNIKDEQHEIKTSSQDSAVFLRQTISRWYVVIRNICIVGMLSILVYVGIKMMLTSVANDKAKYKEMLKDWLVGLCLLFIMHYIMAFSVTMVEKITDIVKTSVDKNFYMAIIQDKDKKISKELKDTDLAQYINDGYLYYPTNLMGYLRIQMQKTGTGLEYVGMIICFLVLVIFTVMFTFTYLKRLLYMAFLTIIAPMVALTYPIDKLNDGQAQGFNTWLKEYIFNLLIQPMHLLLYFILVTSAIELAGKNVIYSLVALGFMLPAEKLLRGMFGFEKAKTPPLLGGPAGTALMMQGINTLTRIAGGGRKGGLGRSGGSKEEKEGGFQIPTKDIPGLGEFLEGDTSLSSATIGPVSAATVNPEREKLDKEQQDLLKFRNALPKTGNGALSGTSGLGRQAYAKRMAELNRKNAEFYKNQASITASSESGTRRTTPRRAASPTIAGARGRVNSNSKLDDFKNSIRYNGAIAGKFAAKKVGNAIRMAPSAAAGTIAGSTVGFLAGSAGLAAGIASGDMSKAVTGAGAGISAGYALGRGIAGDNHISPDLEEAIKEVNESPEYQEYATDKYIEKTTNDENLWRRLEAIDKETTDKMRQNNHLEDYLRYGYETNEEGLKDMIASEKLINDTSDDTRMINSTERAAAVRKTTKRMGNIHQMTADKEEKWHNTFSKEYGGGENADNMATQTINLAKAFDKARPH